LADDANIAQLRDLVPLIGTLGIELVSAAPELVQARLAWAPELCTAGGLLHGGALMALADTTGGICAYLNLPDGATATATVESKTNFIRAVTEGTVTASSSPLHRGRQLAVIETDLIQDDGRLAAKVTQTQIFRGETRS
jgi:1,4-dihydroxy-2-naphthoyl-CoA hydrolase